MAVVIIKKLSFCHGFQIIRCENYEFCIKTRNFVSKSHKNEELCIKNEEFCIQNDEFCRAVSLGFVPTGYMQVSENDEFCIKNTEFCIKNKNVCI